MLNNAADFRKFWHTLTPEQIATYIQSGKLKKGNDLDAVLNSKGAQHGGGLKLKVYFAVNEGTTEEPVWVRCYESGEHQINLTASQVPKLYETVLSLPEFANVAEFYVAANGGFLPIEHPVEEPVQEEGQSEQEEEQPEPAEENNVTN